MVSSRLLRSVARTGQETRAAPTPKETPSPLRQSPRAPAFVALGRQRRRPQRSSPRRSFANTGQPSWRCWNDRARPERRATRHDQQGPGRACDGTCGREQQHRHAPPLPSAPQRTRRNATDAQHHADVHPTPNHHRVVHREHMRAKHHKRPAPTEPDARFVTPSRTRTQPSRASMSSKPSPSTPWRSSTATQPPMRAPVRNNTSRIALSSKLDAAEISASTSPARIVRGIVTGTRRRRSTR